MMTVKQYQSTLHYYFAYYNGRIDGKVGSQTKAAIKAFQKAYGLSADGIYGTKTDAKLKGLVKNLQNNLKHYYGYYSGKIDGIIGSGTVAAIKRFQKGHNLTQDGIYGSSSHSRLTAQIKKLQRIVGVTQDGIIGTKTIAAIKAKQKSWGLTQDGVAGQKFWAKANGSGSGSSSSSSSGGSSAHFKKSEFKCGCNGRYCNGYPAGNMSPKLLDILEKIRAYYGKPITITSGQRCSTYNRQVGGVSNSAHRKAKAADIYIPGVTDTRSGRNAVINLAYKYGAAYSYANTPGMGNAVHINV